MSPEVIDALVRLVANGRKFGVADAVVIEHLVEMGVPTEHAPALLREIGDSLRQGADAAQAGGDPPAMPPASPLQVAAFLEGRRSVAAKQRHGRQAMIVTVVALVVVVLLVVWFTR